MRQHGWLILALPLALAVAGCGDDGGIGDFDAGPDGGGGAMQDAASPDGDGGPAMDGDAGPVPDGGGAPDGGGSPDGGGPPPDGGSTDSGVPPTMDGGIGASCSDDGDCAGSSTCFTEVGGGGFTLELPGGYCSKNCTSGDECGPGATCAGGSFGMGYCAKTCDGADDCRTDEGYTCGSGLGGGTMYCRPDMMTPGGGDGGFPGF